MPFVNSDDVRLLHADVQAERSLLGMAVLSCTAKLDAATVTEWAALNTRIGLYLGEEPSTIRAASQMDQGQRLQREMQPWHARLQAAGCAGVPAAPPPPSAEGGLSGILDTLKSVAPLLIAAYLVHEFAGRR